MELSKEGGSKGPCAPAPPARPLAAHTAGRGLHSSVAVETPPLPPGELGWRVRPFGETEASEYGCGLWLSVSLNVQWSREAPWTLRAPSRGGLSSVNVTDVLVRM